MERKPCLRLFNTFFSGAIHLLCSLHMKRNVKAKLHELRVGDNLQQIVIGDIFGKQIMSERMKGLIDSENDDEFEESIKALCKKWESLDSHYQGPLHAFGRWFCQHEKALLKNKILKQSRIKAELGNPPSHFTTNSSESMNAVLKSKVDYKKSELPVFLKKLKSVIDEQQSELEWAIIDHGKYRLCDEYKKLEVKEDHWFMKMSHAQRETHIKHVLSHKVGSKVYAPRSSSTSSMKIDDNDTNHLVAIACSQNLVIREKS